MLRLLDSVGIFLDWFESKSFIRAARAGESFRRNEGEEYGGEGCLGAREECETLEQWMVLVERAVVEEVVVVVVKLLSRVGDGD